MGYYSVTLRVVKCISTESGIDEDVISQLSGVASAWFNAGSAILGEVKDPKAQALSAVAKLEAEIAEKVPGVIGSIEAARNDPDELYISPGNKPGHAVWPSVGKAKKNNYGIRTGGIWVGKTDLFPFSYKRDDEDASFSLWEYDVGSRDDFLGSFMVRPNEIGKRMSQLIVGVVEKSAYIIEYDVNPEDDEGSEMYLKIKNSPMGKSPMFKILFGG